MIALDHVNVQRGGRDLVRDLSHELKPGCVTVLLGANGAGKSTLIRLLSGEWQPAHGRVMWEGANLNTHRPADLARRRAVVGQTPPHIFSFRVLDVVLLGRLPHTRYPDAHDLDVALEALDLVGMAGMTERSVDTLSGGERQRVHFARAIAQLHEARRAGRGVLLLDEPTAHLDLVHQQRVLELARRFAAEGLSVLSVLHDVNLAASFADQIMLLHNGRLLAAGSVALVLTCPLLREALQIDLERVQHHSGRPVFIPSRP
jgi:iron complex transport system ATP-binding protein